MTYAKQLKGIISIFTINKIYYYLHMYFLDYENAVLQKRLEELADDEINALMEEIEAESEKEEQKK